MSFLDMLQIVGDRLRIVEAAPKKGAGKPMKVVTRTITLAELKTEIRSEEVRSLADLPAELGGAFEKIFEAAGIERPAQGWDVARLRAILQSDAFKGKDRAAAQQSLLQLLHAEQARAEDLIKEAMAQDRALDEFEAGVRKKVGNDMADAEHEVAGLDARIRALQEERARLAARIQLDRDRLREWCRQKRAYERELAGAVGYLTDRPVITTDDKDE